MSTQQLDNGPPGDQNYFNVEDEETHRATGSGRNPDAPTWDPEKMELRHIVDTVLEAFITMWVAILALKTALCA